MLDASVSLVCFSFVGVLQVSRNKSRVMEPYCDGCVYFQFYGQSLVYDAMYHAGCIVYIMSLLPLDSLCLDTSVAPLAAFLQFLLAFACLLRDAVPRVIS